MIAWKFSLISFRVPSWSGGNAITCWLSKNSWCPSWWASCWIYWPQRTTGQRRWACLVALYDGRYMSLCPDLQIEKLRSTLSLKKNLLEFRRPIRLPLDPATIVTGIVAENASMFKSALTPAKLGFKTTSGSLYWVSTNFQVGCQTCNQTCNLYSN